MEKPSPTVPLLISERNALFATGQQFRFLRGFAQANGVPIIRVGRKSMIPALALLQALEREGHATRDEHAAAEPDEGSVDELEAMRAKLGMRRAGGGS